MRCPACDAENREAAATCLVCGKALIRRPRRRGPAEEDEAPSSETAERRNAAALTAYRLALVGLLPGPGLLLGPLALLLGGIARIRGNGDPDFTAQGQATAAILLGALIAVTQWLGAALITIGLADAR